MANENPRFQLIFDHAFAKFIVIDLPRYAVPFLQRKLVGFRRLLIMNRIISRSFVVRLALSLALAGCLSGNALAQQTGWPRSFSNSGGSLVLYQPQVDDWKNYSVVNARSAFALTPTGGKECVGVVTFTLQTVVDMDKHTVFLYSPSITNIYL